MMCAKCGELKPLENRELSLCSGCNAGRLKGGYYTSKAQLAREHQKARRQRIRNKYKR